MLSFSFLEWNSGFTDFGQPCLTNLLTLASIGSWSVQNLICLTITGKISKFSGKNNSSSISISLSWTGIGSWLNTSAFACSHAEPCSCKHSGLVPNAALLLKPWEYILEWLVVRLDCEWTAWWKCFTPNTMAICQSVSDFSQLVLMSGKQKW